MVRRPSAPERTRGIETGAINAVFDEGLKSWWPAALAHGMKFVQLDEPALAHMESLGYRRGVLSHSHFPGYKECEILIPGRLPAQLYAALKAGKVQAALII